MMPRKGEDHVAGKGDWRGDVATEPEGKAEPDIKEVVGVVTRHVAPGPGHAWELLAATRFRCIEGGPLRDGLDCLACDRFINFAPAKDRHTIVIRCFDFALDDAAALPARWHAALLAGSELFKPDDKD